MERCDENAKVLLTDIFRTKGAAHCFAPSSHCLAELSIIFRVISAKESRVLEKGRGEGFREGIYSVTLHIELSHFSWRLFSAEATGREKFFDMSRHVSIETFRMVWNRKGVEEEKEEQQFFLARNLI
ncbi:hypothetical protein CEXT_629521 [Caerostris extrusa]|uniref:Uncharacterized protein n=1 Tax=Caerostris extrusa TaxID=172846 RepID=A0AAV4QQP4_CAEEX|nr:hypothetical protein CEXT_629521 [Caerostris extrusa]